MAMGYTDKRKEKKNPGEYTEVCVINGGFCCCLLKGNYNNLNCR
jgi:hypothetical protein